MENGWFIWILKNRLIFGLLFLVFMVGCFPGNSIKQEERTTQQHKNLNSGDIVLRLGNGYFSSIFKEYASKEKKYSHIGIISVENGVINVYHAEASELTGIGRVKRETLEDFLKDITVFDFFRLDNENASNIASVAHDYYKAETPFDLDFNYEDDTSLYCAELVANAINTATNDVTVKPTIVLAHKTLYGLDDIYLKLHKLSN